MTDRRNTTTRADETFKSDDAPDIDIHEPRHEDEAPHATVRGDSLEGPNNDDGAGFAGISMGILWTAVILLVVAAAVILFIAL